MNLHKITQPFLEVFPGDFSNNSQQRQTPKVLFATVKPEEFPDPKLVLFNEELAKEIGLGTYEASDLKFLVGNDLPDNVKTYATAYAGHQFGNWAGQLGDGRAIFAGEIINENGERTELQWKGVGATPYSRFADGRAVFRSSLREYLMSEALHHLQIPTTRALSLAFTGEDVIRDMMYDGHPEAEPGAAIVRTAESFLRFGHFELISAQKEIETLQKLTDYTISNYFKNIDIKSESRYKDFFNEVCDRTADLMVEWLRVGFVHGVMNTDNMSVLGLTIDYGPFSMLDEFDLNFTPNTTDLPGRRYAFGRQPQIAQWNVWQFSNSLFPLINDAEFLQKTLEDFGLIFWKKHDEMMASKFGFDQVLEGDDQFFVDAQEFMFKHKLDYTLFFKFLEREHANDNLEKELQKISYLPVTDAMKSETTNFLEKYQRRISLNKIPRAESVELMKKTNPTFILRNYLLYQCIEETAAGNEELLRKLLVAIQTPYQEVFPEFSAKRSAKFEGLPGCSTLSCSS